MSLVALVDCNNFFVSCERVFNPRLIGKPVVVASSNDGCIVARSQEAKKIGLPMGAPLFKWADLVRTHDVVVCSCNFVLYSDLSHRVMETLAHFNPEMEIYSVDEAFLSIEGVKDPLAHCRMIREKVIQWTGIPVSIGIAPSKTLAKIANHCVKRHAVLKGLFMPTPGQFDKILDRLPVAEIWGIGRRLATRLAKKGIHTALQLRQQDDTWIKQQLSVMGLKTVWELRGQAAITLDEAPAAKQSITTSRTFGRPITELKELKAALANYAARGTEKLREEKKKASWLEVYMRTSPHRENFYSNCAQMILPQPTDYTPDILAYAERALVAIFKPGYAYKKAGILLGGLVPKERYQTDLFVPQNLKEEEQHTRIMELLDHANQRFGYDILQFAAQGTTHPWQTQRGSKSPAYTTKWDELLTIQI